MHKIYYYIFIYNLIVKEIIYVKQVTDFFRLFAILTVVTVTTIAAIACLGNLTDPESNMQFVRHIFMMDTTYQSSNLMWRSIELPLLHWIGFGCIILIELCIAITGYIGTYKLFRRIFASEEIFDEQKYLSYIAVTLVIVVWGFIFQAAGGEWFASWQSESWNGLRDATRIVMLGLGAGTLLRLAK